MNQPGDGQLNPPHQSENAESRRRRLAETLHRLSTLTDGEVAALPEGLLNDLEAVVSDLTHQGTSDPNEVVVLDSESVSGPDFESEGMTDDPSLTRTIHILPTQEQDLLLHVRPGAGRATVSRPRGSYFTPRPALTPAEQEERSARSRAANRRRAFREAADYAIEMDCRLWITLTFDDQHDDFVAKDECGGYLQRVARAYKKQTGKNFHYRGVVATHGGRPHLHALVSVDADPDLLREKWRYGAIDFITEIDADEVEGKVRYMLRNIEGGRKTYARFLGSRGERTEILVAPVNDFDEAREVLRDIIHPHEPVIVYSQPFGVRQRMGFKFPPQRRAE